MTGNGALAALALVVASCTALPTAVPGSDGLTSSPSGAHPTASPTIDPAGPTPIVDIPPAIIDERSVTRVCSEAPEGDGQREVLGCYSATELALRVTGADGPIQRSEVRFLLDCARFGPCPEANAYVGYVLVGFGNGRVVALRVEQTAEPGSGQILRIFPPIDVDPGYLLAPPFAPPQVDRPALSDDPPEEFLEREALPYCGVETAGDRNDGARECFISAVLAGGRAEFIRHTFDSHGVAITSVFRFGGTGSVELWFGQAPTNTTEGRWQHLWCDVILLSEPRWFAQGSCSD